MQALATLVLSGVLLVSCSKQRAETGPQRSLEQRLAELEGRNSNPAPISEAEAKRQHERNMKEIESMGLVKRAQMDFGTRLTNATVESWTIGYFMHTNTVWCDVRYRLPGRDEVLQKEYGYTRKSGTNWSLIWEFGARPK